jgi:hypothetical protein
MDVWVAEILRDRSIGESAHADDRMKLSGGGGGSNGHV